MKGKNIFSTENAVKISDVLIRLRNSDRTEQKLLRAKLRNDFNFYISDFTKSNSGFTINDFQSLIKNRKITIISPTF